MTKELIYREAIKKILRDEMQRLKIAYNCEMAENIFHKDYSYLLDCLTEVERLYKLISEEPAVDAVEVVRCKDCRHWRRLWHNKPDGICRLYDISDGEFSTEENAYCSRGERRKDNA